MSQLNSKQKLDILFKLFDLSSHFLQRFQENQESESLVEGFDMYQSLGILISIYSIHNNELDDAFYLSTKVQPFTYFENSKNFFTPQKRRDDQRVIRTLAAALYYSNCILLNTTFTLPEQLLYQFDKLIDLNTYLYNTENEDGNKTEYEDLSSIEKKYTDNIMDSVQDFYKFKSTLFDLNKVEGFKSDEDVRKYPLTEVLNYIEDSVFTLYSCMEDVQDLAYEYLMDNLKTVIELYFETQMDIDIDLKDTQYKKSILKFLTEDLEQELREKWE
jgi:hypothetical protein